MKHIAWDYENSTTQYYHIYSVTDEGDELLPDAVTIEAPQNDSNDEAVMGLVVLLDALAGYPDVDGVVGRLRETLIKQVGDTRECPCCRKSFILEDATSKMALKIYKELFG